MSFRIDEGGNVRSVDENDVAERLKTGIGLLGRQLVKAQANEKALREAIAKYLDDRDLPSLAVAIGRTDDEEATG